MVNEDSFLGSVRVLLMLLLYFDVRRSFSFLVSYPLSFFFLLLLLSLIIIFHHIMLIVRQTDKGQSFYVKRVP